MPHPKHALIRLGYFGEEEYISIGDPYKEDVKGDSRHQEAQIKTNMTLKGKYHMINGFFDPKGGVGVGVGAPYTTLEKERLKQRLASKGKMASDQPWKPANPAKKAGGTGYGNMSTHFGTTNYIGQKTPAYPEGGRIEYVEQGDRAGIKKGDVQFAARNIVTNPVKKGTFGYTNTTIGVPLEAAVRKDWKGSQGEYAYMPDPYDAARDKRNAEKAKGPQNISENPFRPAGPTPVGGPGRWGGTKVGGTRTFGGQMTKFPEYVDDPVFQPKRRAPKTEAEVERDPFRPTNPGKIGGAGTWGTFGKGKYGGLLHTWQEYQEDPYDNRYRMIREERRKIKEKQAAMNRAAFSSTVPAQPRSTRTVSIFKMNIRI